MDAADHQNNAKRSEDVYDRQIRLWGADAQAKMSQTKVLYIHMTGASSEVLKNLVLAGIRPAICDNRNVMQHLDFLKQTPSFFWARQEWPQASSTSTTEEEPSDPKRPKTFGSIAELVKPTIEDLNPLLGDCELLPHAVADLTSALLQPFSVVVASHLTPQEALDLRQNMSPDHKLFWIDSMGWHGSCWVDLGPNHVFRAEKGKNLLPAQPLDTYLPLADMWKLPLHLATSKGHKQGPPAPLLLHCALLAYCQHKQAWPYAGIDADEFVQFIRTEWLPATSPSLLDQDFWSETALQKAAKEATCEMIPVCSVIGGMVGNEVIKAISGKGEPANNTILFDGTTCQGWYFLFRKDPRIKE